MRYFIARFLPLAMCVLTLMSFAGCERKLTSEEEYLSEKAPYGMWVSDTATFTVEPNGTFTWEEGGQVTSGSYTFDDESEVMTVTINGETFDLDYERSGLSMTVEFPDSEPVTMTQM